MLMESLYRIAQLAKIITNLEPDSGESEFCLLSGARLLLRTEVGRCRHITSCCCAKSPPADNCGITILGATKH